MFLINPNGVLFTPTAQVNVGGIIASTRNIGNDDFLAGRYRFSGASDALIRNEGQIKTAEGGTVAMIAARIENVGQIDAPKGNVLLGAGNTVTLDLGAPVKIQVEQGALDALIEQGGAIKADGGLVYLTAKAADTLSAAVINHTGITEARSIATGEDGAIYLMGDMQSGTVKVAGTLDASAPTGGKGGFVETSAARVKVEDGAQVKAGHWLIDPTDYTIAATGGDISGTTLSSNLATSNVTIQTNASGTGNGDIFVKDDVTWSSGNTLTLSAHRNIEILATLDASGGLGGKVALEYGQGAPAAGNTATYSFGLTGAGFTGKINLQAGPNFTTKLGSDGATDTWTVITALGSAGSTTGTDLQGMAGNLSGNYVLGADIDASATSGWNSGAGFAPIGDSTNNFTGRFDGLGHTISNLTINRPSTNYVGLFGYTNSATLRNVGLMGGSVSGTDIVGGLVGYGYSGTISQSYATGNVSGTNIVGGLVGYNYSSTISQSYATGSVSGTADYVGGLVGYNGSSGTISQSYATGSVSGNNYVGGLVGYNYSSTISQSYATGSVSGNNYVGGLVGNNSGTITDSFWDTDTSGQTTSAGGTGKTTAEMKQLATYTAAGWDIDDAGGTGKVWRIYEGNSYPLLRWALTPLTITSATDGSKTYDGNAVTSLPAGLFTFDGSPDASKFLLGGSLYGQKNAGSYTAQVYSTQDGYDLIGTRSVNYNITARPVSLGGSRTYNGTNAVDAGIFTLNNLVTGEDLTLTGSGTVTDKNVGNGKPVTLGSLALGDGTNGLASNYTLTGGTHTANITPKALTASYTAQNKVYDGTTAATVSATSGDIIGSDVVTISATGAFDNKNVGTGKTVTVSGGALSGADAGNYSLTNATGTTTADITAKALTVSGITANNKVYDGGTAATLNYSDSNFAGLISGDTVTASGAFADKNVGTNKTVTLAFAGADVGNYTFGGQTTATADITPKALTASYTAQNKVYDGTTAATVSATSGDIIGSDVVTISATGAFDNKNVGTGKTVTVSGGALSGADAGNYSLTNATGTTTADITAKALTVSGITANNKVYDGGTAATLNYSDSNFAGLISGDTVTASGAFADKNVGTNKTVTLAFAGADVGNYTFGGQTTATADITARPITVTADAKSKFVGQPDPALTYTTGCGTASSPCGLVAGESLSGSLVRVAGEGVGTYAIQQGTVTNANNPNYAIAYVGADLTIDAAQLSGAAGDAQSSALALGTQPSAPFANSPSAQGPQAGPDEGGEGAQPGVTTLAQGMNSALLAGTPIRVISSGIRLPEGILPDDEDDRRRGGGQ